MTGTSARNPLGIFKTKKAKILAIEYNLDLYNKNCYPSCEDDKLVTLFDVKYIVYELWHAYFTYGTNKPKYNISKKDELIIHFHIFPEQYN